MQQAYRVGLGDITSLMLLCPTLVMQYCQSFGVHILFCFISCHTMSSEVEESVCICFCVTVAFSFLFTLVFCDAYNIVKLLQNQQVCIIISLAINRF